jgi:hypothetical protein
MDTIFLLYTDEVKRAMQTEEDRAEAMANHWGIMDDAKAQGKFKGASPLQGAKTAVTVRGAGGGTLTTIDGPFAETKEVLGGYYIIDCNDADEAKYWAGRLALTGCIGAVEIRPLAAIPNRAESLAPVHAHA